MSTTKRLNRQTILDLLEDHLEDAAFLDDVTIRLDASFVDDIYRELNDCAWRGADTPPDNNGEYLILYAPDGNWQMRKYAFARYVRTVINDQARIGWVVSGGDEDNLDETPNVIAWIRVPRIPIVDRAYHFPIGKRSYIESPVAS